MTTHENQLAHGQRLQLIGALAAGVAHDLNNQLSLILNHLDFAIVRLDPGYPMRAELLDVQSAATRCAEMVGDLVAVARKTGRFKKISLEPVLSETVRLLRRIVPAGVNISLAIGPDLPLIYADATQIQQVLINLSLNARDAMPRGGQLDITARNDEGGIGITVTDTGHGIPAAVLGRIFEPFFTTKAETGGSGLGLAMVDRIMKEHGGTIVVNTGIVAGMSFYLRFPQFSPNE